MDKNIVAKGWQTFPAQNYAFLVSIDPYFGVYANGWLDYISLASVFEECGEIRRRVELRGEEW